MKITEVRERDTNELQNMEKDLARELWQARLDNHTNQLDDTAKVRRLRRDIAKVKTVLREREQEDVQGSPKARAARPGGVRAEGAGGPRTTNKTEQE